MLSGNAFKISRRRCAFLSGFSLLSFLGCDRRACLVQPDQVEFGSSSCDRRIYGLISLRFIFGRLHSSTDRRFPQRPVPDGMVFRMTHRIAYANIMFSGLQEGLRGHAVISKPRFFRELKITLDELLGGSPDLALRACALKDTAAGIALLLLRAGFARSPSVMWFHKPIWIKQREYGELHSAK